MHSKLLMNFIAWLKINTSVNPWHFKLIVCVYNSVNHKLSKNTERNIKFLNETHNWNGYILLQEKDTSYRTHGLITSYCVFPHKVCTLSTHRVINYKGWSIIINALTHNMTDGIQIATWKQKLFVVHTLMYIRLHFKMCL